MQKLVGCISFKFVYMIIDILYIIVYITSVVYFGWDVKSRSLLPSALC